MTARTQAEFVALVQGAVQTPPDVTLTNEQWQRLSSVIEPKVGGFGTKVSAALKAKLTQGDGPGNPLSETEAKAAIALLKVASALTLAGNMFSSQKRQEYFSSEESVVRGGGGR